MEAYGRRRYRKCRLKEGKRDDKADPASGGSDAGGRQVPGYRYQVHLSGRIGNGLFVLQRKSYTGVSYKKEVYGPFVPGDGKGKR